MKRATLPTRRPRVGSSPSTTRQAGASRTSAGRMRSLSAILLDDGPDAPYWELADRIARGGRIRGHAF